jgi:HEPN domain-containing protein
VTRKEEEKNLLRRAKEFLETAEYQASKGFFDLAVFSLEQALQLFLKAKILVHGVNYPRTHSVRELLEILSKIVSEDKKDIIKNMLQSYLLELGILEDAYITSRYVMREFTRKETEKLTKAVKEIMENVA